MSNQQTDTLPPNPPWKGHDRVVRLALGPKNKRQPLLLHDAGKGHAIEAVAALASLAHQLMRMPSAMLCAPLYMEFTPSPWTSLEGLPQAPAPDAHATNHDATLAIVFKAPPFPFRAIPHAHLTCPTADAREQACLLGYAVVVEAPTQATFAMDEACPDHHITIMAGQAGTCSLELANQLQRSLVSFLQHTGRLQGDREDQGDDHLLYLGAQQLHWLHAERLGFFEAILSPGDHFAPGQPLGRLVQPFDAATPQQISCPYPGIVLASRQVRPVEAGDPMLLVGMTNPHD